MSKSDERAAIAASLKGIGEHETGCHTESANEIALYVQTTRDLYDRRERVFADLLKQKKSWKGMSEFNVLVRLDVVGRALFRDAVASYEDEILNRGRKRRDEEGNRVPRITFTDGNLESVGGLERTRQDFILWLAREFEGYIIDKGIEERDGRAA